jgi:hypothetical protein
MSSPVTFSLAPAHPVAPSATSSDSSYTEKELMMGRDMWVQSPDTACPNPTNQDGTWNYSPAVEDQVELLQSGKVSENEIEKEMKTLIHLMESEEEANKPETCPLDIAEAIDDNRLNPWEFGAQWEEEKALTKWVRFMIWQGGSPEFLPADRVPDEEEEDDGDDEDCICGMSDFDFEDCEACLGRGLNALVIDGGSEEQVERANARLAKTLKYEALRFHTDEACRREAEREVVEEEVEEGSVEEAVDEGHFNDFLGRWDYPGEVDETGELDLHPNDGYVTYSTSEEEVVQDAEVIVEVDEMEDMEDGWGLGFDLGEGGDSYEDEC